MKQEIHCPACAEKMKATIKRQPGESMKFTVGRALNEYHCDYCGEIIEPLAKCYAFSIWSGEKGIPFILGWERRYILTEGPP